MADAARQKALRTAQKAQAGYERNQAGLEKAQEMRRAAFAEAQKAGFTLREIAEATGLHWTRVGQLIREK